MALGNRHTTPPTQPARSRTHRRACTCFIHTRTRHNILACQSDIIEDGERERESARRAFLCSMLAHCWNVEFSENHPERNETPTDERPAVSFVQRHRSCEHGFVDRFPYNRALLRSTHSHLDKHRFSQQKHTHAHTHTHSHHIMLDISAALDIVTYYLDSVTYYLEELYHYRFIEAAVVGVLVWQFVDILLHIRNRVQNSNDDDDTNGQRRAINIVRKSRR